MGKIDDTPSAVVPAPESVPVGGDSTDPRLYAMHLRIEKSWPAIPPTWGTVTTSPTSLESYGELLTYARPDEHAIVESAGSVHDRDLAMTDALCASIASQFAALAAEKQALQAELQGAAPGQNPARVAQIKALNAQLTALNEKKKICDAKAARLAKP